jgi:hypothetical protein
MDLLSRRSTDAVLVEGEAVPSTGSLRGGMVYTFGKRDYQVSFRRNGVFNAFTTNVPSFLACLQLLLVSVGLPFAER